MKIFLKSIYFIILFALTSCNPKTETTQNWIQLFNGKDLNNWQVKIKGHELGDNYKNTFRVEDGLLKVRYDEWDEFNSKFGHIFYKEEFSHYKLHVEYRFVDEQLKGGDEWAYRNNGLMIHGQTAESMELNQDFPVSIEVQLLGGNGTDERSNMNLCTPGTNVIINGRLIEDHVINSKSKTYHGDQWVSVMVEVKGGELIKHYIDNELIMTYEKPQLDPRDPNFEKLLPSNENKILTKGTISLQSESSPIDFRKVELLVLSD